MIDDKVLAIMKREKAYHKAIIRHEDDNRKKIFPENIRLEYVGVVGVDSGHLHIVDPSRAKEFRSDQALLREIQSLTPGKVTVETATGDGKYSVFKVFDNNKYFGLWINLSPN